MIFGILKSPVVVIGMHRSGTTMLTQILEKAGIFMGADFAAYHESNYFLKINDALLKQQNASWDHPVETTDDASISERSFIGQYTSVLRKPYHFTSLLFQKKWGWKDPRNTYTLGSWLKIFPDMKVIHLLRHGVDTAVSLHERNNMIRPEGKWHSKRLIKTESCFDLWEQYVLQAQSWKERIKKNFIEVRYEEVLKQKEDVIQKISDHIGLNIKTAAKKIADKERNQKEFKPEYDALRDYARRNLTIAKSGYVVE